MRLTSHPECRSPFERHLIAQGYLHGKCKPHSPWQNGFVERSHRTDNEELFDQYRFSSPEERKLKLKLWEMEYNHDRPHQGLGGKTPMQRFHELFPFDLRDRIIT
jgi:IS30 family transposase